MAFDTAGTIINDAAVELGLSAVADPFASGDPNFIQLCGLLKSSGRDLWREKQWTHLQQERVFATVTGVSKYALPVDFGSMINQSGWNRSTRFPLGGPLSPQEWQYLQGLTAGVVLNALFRPLQQQMDFFPVTGLTAGQIIAYEYVSSFWVVPAATTTTITGLGLTPSAWAPFTAYLSNALVTNGGRYYLSSDPGTSGGTGPAGITSVPLDGTVPWAYVADVGATAPTASADVIWFDPQLVLRKLKLAWLKGKGLDYTAAQQDYDATLAQVKGDDSASPILRLGGSGIFNPLIGDQNVPITGFGS